MKRLTNMALIFTAISSASAVMADGFKCRSRAHKLDIQIYNSTNPAVGTRTPAIAIISDSDVAYGNRTIARYTPVRQPIWGETSENYVGTVGDPSFSGGSGENIAGTKLGKLDSIGVSVDFSYGTPVPHGTYLRGKMTLVKNNGELITGRLHCTRYLKNPN